MSVSKSLSDFGGSINTSTLKREIEDSSIAKTLQRIDRCGNNITIVFNEALSEEETTTLNGVISSHNSMDCSCTYHPSKLKANLMDASLVEGRSVYVSDATTSGGILCFSNGTDWVRCDDLNPV